MPQKLKMFLFWLWQWTWGLPQNLVGGVLCAALALRGTPHAFYHYAVVMRWDHPNSLSLGAFLFVSSAVGEHAARRLTTHEYGHSLQSLLLGPLYVPVILLPSMVWCGAPAVRRRRAKRGRGYYTFYTERWANHLAAHHTGDDVPDWL